MRNKSRELRSFACNTFLIGFTTGLSDAPNSFATLAHDQLTPIWKLLEEIENTENTDATDETFCKLWKKFFDLVKQMRYFLGPKSPISKHWKDVQRNSLIDLKERIILDFGPF
jgi:phage terminase small subunit